MASFEESSHKAHWLLSASELERRSNASDRAHLSAAALEQVYARVGAFVCALCKELGLRYAVQATALLFVRRFYVDRAFADYDPRLVAPTCLWLAAKCEESALSHVQSVVRPLRERKLPFENHDVLSCECVVLEALNFDLVVYHPFQMLGAMLRDQQRWRASQPERRERRERRDKHNLPASLWYLVNDAYLTAAPLLHPPHIIALGCFHVHEQMQQKTDELNEWFASLDVDHTAVWDVARRLLEHYELSVELKLSSNNLGLDKLLDGLPLNFEHQAPPPQQQQQQRAQSGAKRQRPT